MPCKSATKGKFFADQGPVFKSVFPFIFFFFLIQAKEKIIMGVMLGNNHELKVTNLILRTSLCSAACPHQVTFNMQLLSALSHKPPSLKPVEVQSNDY